MKPLSKCTVLITGSTDGLGKATAEWFAKENARVLLHGKNDEKGSKTLKVIKDSTGNDKLEYYNGDFSSLQSVSELAENIVSNEEEIDILINNAGIGGGPKSDSRREISEDGFELRFAVNYMAQVLLTRKLLPLINEDARINNVASVGQSELDFDDLGMESQYEGFLAYARSKLALIMFTFDLASELKEKDVVVNAIHPSTLMKTNMVEDHFGTAQSTVEEGLDAVLHLSTSEDLEDVTGEFFDGKSRSRALSQAYDIESREKLKNITEDIMADYIKWL